MEKVSKVIKRFISDDGFGHCGVMEEDATGEWVRHEDVLAALQTLIDQLATNHEWRNGAVLAYNAISQ